MELFGNSLQGELTSAYEHARQSGTGVPTQDELRKAMEKAGCPTDEGTFNALLEAITEVGHGKGSPQEAAHEVARVFDKNLIKTNLNSALSGADPDGKGFQVNTKQDLAAVLDSADIGDMTDSDLEDLFAKCQAQGTSTFSKEQLVTVMSDWAQDKLEKFSAALEDTDTSSCVVM